MIKSLASLRFVFAFMVFLHHIDVLEDAIGHAFFYTLSGFILSYVYADRFQQRRLSRKRFLQLRCSRLYPLYLLTFLLAIPLSIGWLKMEPLNWMVGAVSTLLMVQSFIPDPNIYFSFNGLAWSLSDLFFFYALFPFLVVFLLRIQRWMVHGIFVLAAFLILGAMFVVPESWQHWTFYINPLFRIVDFALGILIYRWIRQADFGVYQLRYTYAELLSLGLLILFYSQAHWFPKVIRYSLYYWIPMVSLITVFALQKGRLSQWLSHPVLLFLGELSFGFYLYHQLILRYMERMNERFLWTESIAVLNSITFVLIIALCWLSYRFFEQPLKQRLRRHFFN
ncbi:acyltransferase family protein [Croceiramulus getboli]|nr:acyltransferase [Flavobacteriaceae bacterium YJPT1-3]